MSLVLGAEHLNYIYIKIVRTMRERTAELSRTFSVYLPVSLYEKLLDRAGKGKLNTFIREVLEKELSESENKLVNEYQECYANPRMIKEAKQWEKAGIESWLNYERNKGKPTKVKWSKKLVNGRKVN